MSAPSLPVSWRRWIPLLAVLVLGVLLGVGLGLKPPVFLKRGDVMTLDGGVLGTQRQQVRHQPLKSILQAQCAAHW